MKYGYARVSTIDQDPEMQILALRQDGCERRNIFVDHGRSGSYVDRPQLNKCLSRLQAGDMLVIWKLDRLGRNTRHMLEIVEDFKTRGINLRCLTQNIDTSSDIGKVVFTVLAAVAEYELSQITERTTEGRKLALARIRAGDPSAKPFGRPRSLDADEKKLIARNFRAGTVTIAEIAKDKKVSKATVYRVLREALPSRFPKSKKKNTKLPLTDPQEDVLISPEADLLIDASDPGVIAALEKQLGMTRWQALNQIDRYSGKLDKASAKAVKAAAQAKNHRALN